jgi:organic hydroperoxide reductase OsmC/OhrA
MEISARVRNDTAGHEVTVATAGTAQPLTVSAKTVGRGSAVNGGELLMLALATCYCNDLYREAERLGVEVTACEVVVTAQFGGIGRPAESIVYAARVESPASPDEVALLLSETDRLAEVHNTLRGGCAVQRVEWTAQPPADGR